MKLPVSQGGCWFCQENDGASWFCCEFDCFLHIECLEKAIKEDLNRETEIIAKEFGLIK